MKKEIFTSKILFVLFFLILLGCTNDDEFYTLEKPSVFPYYSADKLEIAAISMYAKNTTPNGWWQNNVATNWVLLDAAGDDIRWLGLNTSNFDHIHFYFRNPTAGGNSDATNLWVGVYSSIGNINSVLDFYEQNDGTPFLGKDGITEEYKNNVLRIKGEALFLRAYNYSLLVPIFTPWYVRGGANSEKILPLKLHYPKTYEETQPELATTQQIYDQMVIDLKEAITLLPKNVDAINKWTKVARANKFVVHGLLARIYFWMGKYDEAQAELDLILNDPELPYNLSKDPVSSWNQTELITTANAPNVMWNSPGFQSDNPGGWWIFTSFIPWSAWGSPSWREYSVSHSMAKKFGWMTNDLQETPEAKLDKRYTSMIVRWEPATAPENQDPTKQYEPIYNSTQIKTPELWVDKFFQVPGRSDRFNVPLMKLSEMYLTRSILRFNKGDKTGALSDLNNVRNYAGLGDFSGALTADDIHIERAKEMLWEGDRYLYLKSLRLDVPLGDRLELDPGNTYVNNTEVAPYKYYWPVPKAETDFYVEK